MWLSGRPRGTGESGHDTRTSRGTLTDEWLQPHFGQFRRHVLGRGPLSGARVVVAGVGGVDPDQITAQFDDLGFGPPGVDAFAHGHVHTTLWEGTLGCARCGATSTVSAGAGCPRGKS